MAVGLPSGNKVDGVAAESIAFIDISTVLPSTTLYQLLLKLVFHLLQFAMAPVILRSNPSPEDDAWSFQTPLPQSRRADMGLLISFSPEKITLDRTLYPQNRILQSDDRTKFVLASFEKLRFPDSSPRIAEAYMIRFFKAGLFLNGTQYRFFGHSNSQLVSCASICLEHDFISTYRDHGVVFFGKPLRTKNSTR